MNIEELKIRAASGDAEAQFELVGEIIGVA